MASPAELTAARRPFTVHDLFEMPDDGFRYEVLDGALIMSPAPDSLHQYSGDELRHLFKQAAPPGVYPITAVAVRIGEDTTTFVPDVTVTTVDPRDRRKWLEAHEVLCVVEVVSPSSRKCDRILEPEVYADAGVPCYWRVELDPEVTVHVHRLDGGHYRLVDTLVAGTEGATTHPFPVRFDPGAM